MPPVNDAPLPCPGFQIDSLLQTQSPDEQMTGPVERQQSFLGARRRAPASYFARLRSLLGKPNNVAGEWYVPDVVDHFPLGQRLSFPNRCPPQRRPACASAQKIRCCQSDCPDENAVATGVGACLVRHVSLRHRMYRSCHSNPARDPRQQRNRQQILSCLDHRALPTLQNRTSVAASAHLTLM